MRATWNTTLAELRPLLVVTLSLLLITTVAYPLAVTGIAQLAFHRQANGSIVSINGRDVGSSLIGQQFTSDAYFQGRPSAAGNGYDASNSSGSNLGPTSDKLINGIINSSDPSQNFDGIKQRSANFRTSNGLADAASLPSDSVTASASGLDPHISPDTALLQVDRVAKARNADPNAVRSLVDQYREGSVFGIFGAPRINVLKLNMELDKRFPMPNSNP